MLPAGLKSAQEVRQHYDDIYFELINSGRAQPFIFPRVFYGVILVLAYLLYDHRGNWLGSKSSRYFIFFLLFLYEAWCVLNNRARNPAASFGSGLISAFSLLWVSTHLVVNDCQTDYKRIERRNDRAVVDSRHRSSQQTQQNGHAGHDGGQLNGSIKKGDPSLYWQSYPSTLTERIGWIFDMFSNFRGVGWNWQTGGVPKAPTWITAQLEGKSATITDEVLVSQTGSRRFTNRKRLVSGTLAKAAIGYLAIDALKLYALYDPYFWGYTDAAAPAFYPHFVQNSYFLTKTARLLVTMTFTCIMLGTIFKLGPIFFAGVLGPRLMGLRGEALMNPPDMFGPFGNVLDKGLAGWWGGFWHQVFRASFEAPAIHLLRVLKLDRKSVAGRILLLTTGFVLSGYLHACGSHTQLGDTRPIRGPFVFFLVQGVGIALETLAWTTLHKAGVELPRAVERTINLAFALFWLYNTGPLLADDFSQGGVWLFEPIPISILRGLGLGPAGSGWLCWDSSFASWRNGESWWDTGLLM